MLATQASSSNGIMNRTPLPSPDSPLLAALLTFNLLPSRLLHVDRAQALWPETPEHADLLALPAVQQSLHRLRSAQLLKTLGSHAEPVTDIHQPQLALALAPPHLLDALTAKAGALLSGTALRQTIERKKVLEHRSQLGEPLYAWVQEDAIELHTGLDAAQLRPWQGDDLSITIHTLGAGLVAQSWQDAPEPLRLRANWRLAPCADRADVRAASGLSPDAARALCMKLIQPLDSTWLSSFPATP